MKIALLSLILPAAALSACGGITPARDAFERPAVAAFARSKLVDAALAPDDVRYDKAAGTYDWVFALPYANDWRLRFIDAKFDGGRFVEGRLKVLGFDPQPLDAAAFEALRAAFPMVAVRTKFERFDGRGKIAVLYRATGVPLTRLITDEDDADEDPAGLALGALADSLERLGLSPRNLTYRVTVTSKAGVAADCGVGAKLDGGRVGGGIRAALEKADPSRKGQVSERDIVDFRMGATVTYVPAGTKPGR